MKNQSLVAKYTPVVAIKKPIKSKLVNFSFKKPSHESRRRWY